MYIFASLLVCRFVDTRQIAKYRYDLRGVNDGFFAPYNGRFYHISQPNSAYRLHRLKGASRPNNATLPAF